MSKRKKRGQSVLEYVILVTAVVAACLVFKSKLNNSLGTNYGNVADKATTVVNNITF
jgi:uncharacterized membrane protein YwaF